MQSFSQGKHFAHVFAPVLWLWPQYSAADCLTSIIWHVETGNWRGTTLLGTEVVPAQRQRSRRWEISSVTPHDHAQQIHADYYLCATEKEKYHQKKKKNLNTERGIGKFCTIFLHAASPLRLLSAREGLTTTVLHGMHRCMSKTQHQKKQQEP